MMKLAISNIAWSKEYDEEIYFYMEEKGVEGLEIAPTRIFGDNPYEQLKAAEIFAKKLNKNYSLSIPSMQSIWYGRKENIFKTKEERIILLEYTKKAIRFAEIISCKNLVFGCPKNRCLNLALSREENYRIAEEFFVDLANYAKKHNTCIGLEANHVSYGTDFITTTQEAFQFVKKINNQGLKVNLDIGNLLQNEECADIIKGNVKWISHVHFSEPGLEELEKRELHMDILKVLKSENYQNYISIEMKNKENLKIVKKTIENVLNYYTNVMVY